MVCLASSIARSGNIFVDGPGWNYKMTMSQLLKQTKKCCVKVGHRFEYNLFLSLSVCGSQMVRMDGCIAVGETGVGF